MSKLIYDGNVYDKYNYESYKFLSVESCGMHVNSNHVTKRAKGRRDYHLLYVKSGELKCLFDGKREVLGSGGYVLYPPGAAQEYEQNGGVCYWVHFSGTCTDEIVTDAGLKRAPIFTGDRENNDVVTAFERMIFRYVTTGHNNSFALTADLLRLFAIIESKVIDKAKPDFDERLCEVITHMHKHYADEVPLCEYAKMAYVSTGRFMHLFKEAMGASPHAYVLAIRMERAAEFLALSLDSVGEIAAKVGFNDALYFSKVFKKRFGISPTEFRKVKNIKAMRRIASTGCD